MYSYIIGVYAKACDLPLISDEAKELIMVDSWKIMEEIIAKGMLSNMILN